MKKNQEILKTAGIILFVFILCVIFIEPLRTRMNNIFTLKDRGELKEEEVIGTIVGYNPRVKEIQGALKAAGFYSGPADGFMGAQTRSAIKKFQQNKGLQATGRINPVTFLALNRQEGLIKPAPMPQEKKFDIQKPAAPPAPIQPQTDPAAAVQIKNIQSALTKAGFYKGKIDGIMGAKTKKAIKDFQSSKGLKPDGIAGPKTLKALKEYF